jgi:hypothetical protein
MKRLILALALAGVVGHAGACGDHWMAWRVALVPGTTQMLPTILRVFDSQSACETLSSPYHYVCLPEGVRP